jgi:hypothetical protein
MMRKFLTFIGNLFAFRRKPASNRHLLGMYFDENNRNGRHKPNRDRA